MIIIRNIHFIAVRRAFGYFASFTGMAVLLGGLLILLTADVETSGIYVFWAPIFALPLGWLVAQVGLYFSNRYVRRPRPDERLDEGLHKVVTNGRLYHFILPVPHVLLTPAGPIVLIDKYQDGDISVEGSRWTQKNVGLMRQLFGQERLGNPTAEAEYRVKQLARFISHNIPELAEVELPIGALIIFTAQNGRQLSLQNSDIPAMHYTKLRGFWKQRAKDTPLPASHYHALRAAFDAEAEAYRTEETASS